jgi:hypothetical protein
MLAVFRTVCICHNPESACEPAGPLATLMNTAFPVTRWVVGVSLNSSVLVLPSGDTISVQANVGLPFFFWMNSTELALTTRTMRVSYGYPVTF